MSNVIEHNHKRILLSESFLFNTLSTEELNELATQVKIKNAKPKQVIFHKSEPGKQMFVIADGKVSVSTYSEDGKELSFGILGKGELFGEIALFDNRERTATVTAIEATQLLVVEQQPFIQFIKQNPEVAIKLLAAMATRLRITDQFYEDTAFRQLPGRLAKKLLALAENFGTETGDGIEISIKLSQNDIGKMSGASRESVNKQMRIWEDNGLIRVEKGYITIQQRESLEAIID